MRGLGIVIGIIALAFFVFWLASPSHKWRQKMVVEVSVNGEIYTGYSVTRGQAGENPINALFGYPIGTSYGGEAVVVELPNNRYLFALLKSARPGGSDGGVRAIDVFSDLLPDVDRIDQYKALSKFRQSLPVPKKQYPMLVTFADINNPKSVRLVDPDNLAASFGAGYRLKSITLEITDDKVTSGVVESVLGWLGLYPEPKLGPATGGTANIPFYRRVAHGDFIRR